MGVGANVVIAVGGDVAHPGLGRVFVGWDEVNQASRRFSVASDNCHYCYIVEFYTSGWNIDFDGGHAYLDLAVAGLPFLAGCCIDGSCRQDYRYCLGHGVVAGSEGVIRPEREIFKALLSYRYCFFCSKSGNGT